MAERDLNRAASPAPDDLTNKVGASELYEAAVARMDDTWASALILWRDALAYCDALKIAIDVLTLLRLRTLSVTTKEHARLRDGFYQLSYTAAEVKTQELLIRSLHPELTPYVEHGFEVASWLAKRGADPTLSNLWVTRDGRPMSSGWISKRIRRASLELVGVPLNPQRIRRLGATSIHRFVPRESMVATSALQHHGPQETKDHYVKTGSGGSAAEFRRFMQSKFGREIDV